ncbi:MAG: DUF4252 domain-containing protein [Paramuribaculum sp.]|nr:DUF4252 domain-containing protein [Paramuribaculum sp.]
MKENKLTKVIIAILIAFCLPLGACAQTRLLQTLPSGNGVNKIFLNKGMINLALKSTASSLKVFSDTDYIEVYNCENAELCTKALEEIEKMLKEYDAETLIETQDQSDSVLIYQLFEIKDGKEPFAIALIQTEKNQDSKIKELNIVIVHGKNLNLNQLESLQML